MAAEENFVLGPKARTSSLRAVLSFVLVLLAVPCTAGGAGRLATRVAQGQALEAQAKLHAHQQHKARQAKAAPGWLGLGNARPPDQQAPAAAGIGPRRPRLARLLPSALAAVLLAAAPQALWAPVQAVPAGLIPPVPTPNLASSNPANVLAAQSVTEALARANATGSLPALDELNTLLAVANPQRFAILGTLPPPPAAPSGAQPPTLAAGSPATEGLVPPTANQADASSEGSAAQARLAPVLTAARKILKVAQLTEASNILQTIANQLFGDSLVVQNHTVATALQVVAFDLAALGFSLSSAASDITTTTAQETLDVLEQQVAALADPQAATPAAAEPPAGAAAAIAANATAPGFAANATAPGPAQPSLRAQPPLGPDGHLPADVIYGTWERFENTPSASRITYQFTPATWVKTNLTLDAEGDETVATEVHPGTVTGYVTYQRRPGQSPLDAALGKIKVTILLEQASGKTTTLAFAYLKAQGSPDGALPDLALEVLMEEDGEKKAFVKTRGPA
jgi:hypothetical protein